VQALSCAPDITPDAVAQLPDDSEVVADEQNGQALSRLSSPSRLTICSCTVTSSAADGFVANQHLRPITIARAIPTLGIARR